MSSAWTTRAIRVIPSSRMRTYMPPDEIDEQLAGGSFVRAHERFAFGETGDDLGAHHLAEERFLGVEIEVDGALAHAGEAGDVVDLGAGEAGLAEDLPARHRESRRGGPRGGAASGAGQ